MTAINIINYTTNWKNGILTSGGPVDGDNEVAKDTPKRDGGRIYGEASRLFPFRRCGHQVREKRLARIEQCLVTVVQQDDAHSKDGHAVRMQNNLR